MCKFIKTKQRKKKRKKKENDGGNGQPWQRRLNINGKVDESGKGEKRGIPWRLQCAYYTQESAKEAFIMQSALHFSKTAPTVNYDQSFRIFMT